MGDNRGRTRAPAATRGISSVDHSECACPVVPIIKSDGKSVRICGDYKLTVNQVSSLDGYSVPKIEDLLATLAGCKIFTKLDLTSAYQEVELDEASKKYTMINTHKGLFQFNRKPYRIKSAPVIFQRITLLKGIPHTLIFLDDILVTGPTEKDHENNLREVLSRLEQKGLRLKYEKCVFDAKEVTYLGKKITEHGVKDVKKTPAPENITQLRSFWGMLNQYSKF